MGDWRISHFTSTSLPLHFQMSDIISIDGVPYDNWWFRKPIRIDLEEAWELKQLDYNCAICSEPVTREYWTFTCACAAIMHEECGNTWLLGPCLRDTCIVCGSSAMAVQPGIAGNHIFCPAQPSNDVLLAVAAAGPAFVMDDEDSEDSESSDDDDSDDGDYGPGNELGPLGIYE